MDMGVDDLNEEMQDDMEEEFASDGDEWQRFGKQWILGVVDLNEEM